MRDESAEATEVEKDICIDCGSSVNKPPPIQLNPFISLQPRSLCKRCEDAWRWREQICVRRPYQLPLWRPTRHA